MSRVARDEIKRKYTRDCETRRRHWKNENGRKYGKHIIRGSLGRKRVSVSASGEPRFCPVGRAQAQLSNRPHGRNYYNIKLVTHNIKPQTNAKQQRKDRERWGLARTREGVSTHERTDGDFKSPQFESRVGFTPETVEIMLQRGSKVETTEPGESSPF